MSPLLQLPASTGTLCFCRCHAHAAADINANSQRLAHGLELDQSPIAIDPGQIDGAAYRTNWVDAVMSCSHCSGVHCLALLCEIPELRARRVMQAFAQARAERPRIKPKKRPRTKWDDERGTTVDDDVTPDSEGESSQG